MKFEEVKEILIEKLKEKVKELGIEGKDGFILCEGFVKSYIVTDTEDDAILAPKTCIPKVMLVDNSTGIVHFFALKSLIK